MDRSMAGLEWFRNKHPEREGRTLVVGSKVYDKQDRRRLYNDALGVDMLPGEGVDLVHDLESPLPAVYGKFDHIDCVSVLEHVRRPWKMAENLEQCLKDEGTILVSVPFVWRLHAYPDDYWRMTAAALPVIFPNVDWKSRKYLVDGRCRNRVPGQDWKGGPWLARAEVIGFGVKR